MEKKEASLERRKHKRFILHTATYLLTGNSTALINDLGLGGISFYYTGEDPILNGKMSYGDIFLMDTDFWLKQVPIGKVGEFIRKKETLAHIQFISKRYSLQFGELTIHQKTQLQYLIDNFGTS